MSDIEENLKKQYISVVKSIENAEAEIECMTRQKAKENSTFSEVIRAEAKLKNAEKLIKNILDSIEKYKIFENDINQQIQISNQNFFQKKQYELDKRYRKD